MNIIRSCSLLLLLTLVAAGNAEEEKGASTDNAQTKVSPTVTLSGLFESEQTSKIVVDVKQAASLKIKKIVPHGTVVEKGEPVVWLETEEIEKQLKEAESKFRLAELAMEETKFDFDQFLDTQRLDKEDAERNWQSAKQAYDAYVEFERKYDIETAEQSLQSAKFNLEYAREDLRQLERMYKEDELTEESEELILTRAKRDVESTEFRLKGTEFRTEQTLQHALPREKEVRESQLTRAQMAYDKALLSLRIAKQKKEIEFADSQEKLNKQEQELSELRDDRKRHVIDAPDGGIVYHGDVDRGQLGDKRSTLDKGTAVTKEQVVATIVNPRRLRIRIDLAEQEITKLRVGLEGHATPTSQPDVKLKVRVEKLETVPYAKGKFDCELSVEMEKVTGVVPGMGCSVTFETEKSGPESSDPKETNDEEKKS